MSEYPCSFSNDCNASDHRDRNLIVIGRMNERIGLLRAEVEKRGMRWADAEVEERNAHVDMTDSSGQLVNGEALRSTTTSAASTADTSGVEASHGTSGRLTDEELRARLQERLLQQGDDDDDEGVHL